MSVEKTPEQRAYSARLKTYGLVAYEASCAMASGLITVSEYLDSVSAGRSKVLVGLGVFITTLAAIAAIGDYKLSKNPETAFFSPKDL